MRECAVAIAALLTGCAASPYAEVGVGYQLDNYTDYWLQTERDFQCSSGPQAHFEVGMEKNNWKLGIHHQSWWLCGGPFNDKPEIYQNDIRLTKKWGGK